MRENFGELGASIMFYVIDFNAETGRCIIKGDHSDLTTICGALTFLTSIRSTRCAISILSIQPFLNLLDLEDQSIL